MVNNHIGISRDMFIEQRIINKKLIDIRKYLNKELRERVTNASYYFYIKVETIIKKKISLKLKTERAKKQ